MTLDNKRNFPTWQEPVKIPLADLAGYLAAHGLEVVGGTAFYGGTFRPALFLRESKHRTVSAGDTSNIGSGD